MMIDAIMAAGSTAHGLATYVGLIEDRIEKGLIALASSEFDAGFRALQQAARSEVECESLLREARGRLNKAISLETGHRLSTAYLGLALCHTALGDESNANVALLELASLDTGKFVGFWDRTFGKGPDPVLLDMRRAARDFLFAKYRYAVPVGGGSYDMRLLKG